MFATPPPYPKASSGFPNNTTSTPFVRAACARVTISGGALRVVRLTTIYTICTQCILHPGYIKQPLDHLSWVYFAPRL